MAWVALRELLLGGLADGVSGDVNLGVCGAEGAAEFADVFEGVDARDVPVGAFGGGIDIDFGGVVIAQKATRPTMGLVSVAPGREMVSPEREGETREPSSRT